MNNWGEDHGVIVKIGCSFMKIFIKISKLDKDTSGWKHIYIYNRHRWWLNYLFTILGIYTLYKIGKWIYPKLKMKKLKFKNKFYRK